MSVLIAIAIKSLIVSGLTFGLLKLMAQHGLNPKAAELKPEDIADMSLCKKLDEAGFFDRLH